LNMLPMKRMTHQKNIAPAMLVRPVKL
jgi:hypothetical protein